jgi:hypothetical protein
MLVAQAFNWMLDAEGDEQCWADARLIACAPELLELLKLVLPLIWFGKEHDAIVAAIAKVEGA